VQEYRVPTDSANCTPALVAMGPRTMNPNIAIARMSIDTFRVALSGRATYRPRDPQLPLIGSLGGPFDYRKTLGSSSMAHWVGQSATEKPSDPVEWPTGWANRPY
jgi:hypothetical protein